MTNHAKDNSKQRSYILGDLSVLFDPSTVPVLSPSGSSQPLLPHPTPQPQSSLKELVAHVSGRTNLPSDSDLLLVPKPGTGCHPAGNFNEALPETVFV